MRLFRRLRAHLRNYGARATLARLYRLALKQELADGYRRETPAAPPGDAPSLAISVIVPVYGAGAREVRECVESIEAQRYPGLQAVLVNDGERNRAVSEFLRRKAREPGFAYAERKENGGISDATNEGIALATGEFCVFLDCDDILERNALAYLAAELARNPRLDLVYSDEDAMSPDGRHCYRPFCKPDWSPESLWSCMYLCHFMAVRTSVVRELGGMRSEFDGAQDWDLALRVAERSGNIGHTPKVLYHWRARRGSAARGMGEKEGSFAAGVRVREAALARRGIDAKVVPVLGLPQARVVFAPPPDALATVVIPSKDNPEILEACLASLKRFEPGVRLELVVVDNGSSQENADRNRGLCARHGARYFFADIPFNYSRLNNLALEGARGGFLCFLNDDTEATRDGWLGELVGQAAQDGVGAVGAKLVYPSLELVQHAGVALLKQGPSHLMHSREDSPLRYFGWSELAWNVSAVTAACLVVERSRFDRAGGFDECFAVAYNDVDLCLRMRYLGLRNVVRNDVRLVHHESLSRGNDLQDEEKRARLARDFALLEERHSVTSGDPYYNPQLDQYRVDFHYDRSRYEAGDFRPSRKPFPSPIASERGRGSYGRTRWRVSLFRYRDGEVHLEGWAFQAGRDSLSLGVELACRAAGRWWSAECRRILRLDVQSRYSLGTDGDYAGCFLSCRLPEGLEPDAWALAIGKGRSRVVVDLTS